MQRQSLIVYKMMTLLELKSLKDEMVHYSRMYVQSVGSSSVEELRSISAKEAKARDIFIDAQQTYLKQFSIFTRYTARDEMTRVLYYSS